MPRIARKNITASYIHVITQGINKEKIFNKSQYKDVYIKLIQKIFGQYSNLNILVYCIMDNHAHLLIYTEDINKLSHAMSRINTSYAIFYNNIEKRTGYVFKNRYYSQEIMSQNHLYNAIFYIHNNPVKANIVARMEEYEYSSYNNYKKGKIENLCVELLFNTKNYFEIFDFIHKNFVGEDIFDINEMEISEEEIEQFVKRICFKLKLEKEDIRKENKFIIMLYKEIKNKFNVTNKEISKILGIGKNRISNILKQKKRDFKERP